VGRYNERVPAAGALVQRANEHTFDAPAIGAPPLDSLLLRQLQTVDEDVVIRQAADLTALERADMDFIGAHSGVHDGGEHPATGV
jgi:hypothetical protein